MRKKQVTLLELAKRLNLSTSTVSRALNDRHRISEKTRQAVKQLAAELEYQPNPSAKSLRESKTYILGVLVPELSHHFFASTISGMEETAINAGYKIMICQSKESYERERDMANTFLASRIDGLIVCLARDTEDVKHLQIFPRKDLPLVMFDRVNHAVDCSKVVVDDFDGARKAVDHLVAQGYRKIAHLAGPEALTNSNDRLNGYLEALDHHGLPIKDEWIFHCSLDNEEAKAYTQQMLDSEAPPDAILAFNDYVAIDAMQVVKERGIAIPEQMGIVGFANVPLSGLVSPSLTTVEQPAYELGKIAAELMLKQLDNRSEEDMEPETMTLSTRLIVRDSSRRLPEAEADGPSTKQQLSQGVAVEKGASAAKNGRL